jgi:uncharacterized protein
VIDMDWKTEGRILAGLLALFLAFYFLPVGNARFDNAVFEALHLLKWYAREHVLLCLVPAFFIAGAISTFLSQASVMRYLGPNAPKGLAYAVASVSGTILAVCSCTVLPLFAGIHRMGAGLGPASAFLYAGPAINVLAIVMTARVLGIEIGIARGVGAVVFSIVIGLMMALMFERRGERDPATPTLVLPDAEGARPLGQLATLFAVLIAILVFANWSGSPDGTGVWHALHASKWPLTIAASIALAVVLWRWYAFPLLGLVVAASSVGAVAFVWHETPTIPFAAGVVALCVLMPFAGPQGRDWWDQTWSYAKLIAPLLVGGVFVAGFLLGTPEAQGIVPPAWIESAVGGNGLGATFGAAVVGAFMYFATLTEVPIVEGLVNAGMGKGPALALLLAGPALSLPNMLVIRGVLGTRKTVVYVTIVVVGSTLAGLVYGALL